MAETGVQKVTVVIIYLYHLGSTYSYSSVSSKKIVPILNYHCVTFGHVIKKLKCMYIIYEKILSSLQVKPHRRTATLKICSPTLKKK